MLTLTSVKLWLCWEQAGSGGILTLTSLTIWLRWEDAGSSGMFTLTSPTIWLLWEQAGSSGSSFAGRGETAFAVSKLVAVESSLSPL